MAQLNIRLDDGARDQLDALADARGVTTSELMRDLIGNALGHSDPEASGPSVTPVSLTAVERLRLAKLFEVLAHLTAVDGEKGGGWKAVNNRRLAEVLTSGYTAEYDTLFQDIGPEMTRRECSLLMDILDMFTQLERSVGALDVKECSALGDSTVSMLMFRGFDFNDAFEGRLASYASYLISTRRWESMAAHFDELHEGGNSHMPMLAAYQRLLTTFRPIWRHKVDTHGGENRYLLSVDELGQVCAGRTGRSNPVAP